MNLAQIRQVSLPVSDLERAVAFYRDILGAAFTASFNPPGLAFFDFAGVRLLLEKGEAGSVIYFAVDDIDGAVAELRSRGLSFDDEPHMIFRDDEGNLLALSERRSSS